MQEQRGWRPGSHVGFAIRVGKVLWSGGCRVDKITFRGLCKPRNIYLEAQIKYGTGLPISGELYKAQSPWEEHKLLMLTLEASWLNLCLTSDLECPHGHEHTPCQGHRVASGLISSLLQQSYLGCVSHSAFLLPLMRNRQGNLSKACASLLSPSRVTRS